MLGVMDMDVAMWRDGGSVAVTSAESGVRARNTGRYGVRM